MKRWLTKATYWVAGILPRTPQRTYRSEDLSQFAGYALRPSSLAMRLLGLGMRLDAEHWDHWAEQPGRNAQKCPECNGWMEAPDYREPLPVEVFDWVREKYEAHDPSCASLPHFWLGREGGFTDLPEIEDCAVCGDTFWLDGMTLIEDPDHGYYDGYYMCDHCLRRNRDG